MTRRRESRAQSAVLGFALLLGLAAIVVVATVALGNVAIDDHQHTADVEQAERAFGELDATADRVALGSADGQRLSLGLRPNGGTVDVHPDSGWLRVQIVNVDTGVVETTVTNRTLGAAVYRNRETTVAYQGGGLWRSDRGEAVMLSPPPLDYRGDTFTVPVVGVGGQSMGDDVRVTRAGSPVREFPNASAGRTNRIQKAKVVLTVQSDYYEAWAGFFAEETNGYVWTDDGAETANVVLLALPDNFAAVNGISATSGTGELGLLGTGAYTDSYNSTTGPYDVSRSTDGTIWSAGSVSLSGDAEVNGSVHAGESVTLSSSASKISGDVEWHRNFSNQGTVTGTVSQIEGVGSLPPIDGVVHRTAQDARVTNDNDESPLVQDRRIDLDDGSTAELQPGTYSLETLRVDGSTLVLNTTPAEPTIIVVEDWAVVEHGGNLTVKGNGTVRVFVEANERTAVSPGNRMVNFHVGKGSEVNVPGQDSPRFRIYAVEDFVGVIAGSNSDNGHAVFDGVLYAPSGATGDGYVFVQQADVYGSVVAANVTLDQYGAVHYDSALDSVTYPPAPTVSRIGFLHVAVHRIRIASSP